MTMKVGRAGMQGCKIKKILNWYHAFMRSLEFNCSKCDIKCSKQINGVL